MEDVETVPKEVGAVLAKRRRSLRLTQEGIPGVSSSLVRTVENGTAPLHGQAMTRATYMQALKLADDAIERLAAGESLEDLERMDGTARPDTVIPGVGAVTLEVTGNAKGAATEPTLADVLAAVKDLAAGQAEVNAAIREMLAVLQAERSSARASRPARS